MIRIFPKRFDVNLNRIGFLFKKKKLVKQLESGVYRYWDPLNIYEVISIPISLRQINITNQEVLTKDNVALRFSFLIHYKIVDCMKLLSICNFEQTFGHALYQVDEYIGHFFQLKIRNDISKIDSETLNEKRAELEDLKSSSIDEELKECGVEVLKAQVKDITFPKNIQDLFAKQLEAKIRAKSDLENARTAVATARALKNAAEMMKGDDNVKFIQYLETITKIASKGKHTFHIASPEQFKNTE